MSPHEILLESNPHLASAWEDLCFGWPKADQIVDALGRHITTNLKVKLRDMPAPLLQTAWRRALACYMLTARMAADPTQLDEQPLLAFVTEFVASIAHPLAELEILCPNGCAWTAMGDVPLSSLSSENADRFERRPIKGDLQLLQQHLVKISVPEDYKIVLSALAKRDNTINWMQ